MLAVVKQRLQMQHSSYRGVWECARGVYRAEGLRAFYRSYGTQVAMSVPFHAVHFAAYEWAQSQLNPARRYSPGTHALAGAAAGALAAAATTPLDVCKTVLNTQVGPGPRPPAAGPLGRRGPVSRRRFAGGGGARRLAARRRQLRAARVGPARLLQGPAGARAVPDAGRRHLLAHLRVAQARARHREYRLEMRLCCSALPE